MGSTTAAGTFTEWNNLYAYVKGQCYSSGTGILKPCIQLETVIDKSEGQATYLIPL